jgi:hypothetical protein
MRTAIVLATALATVIALGSSAYAQDYDLAMVNGRAWTRRLCVMRR